MSESVLVLIVSFLVTITTTVIASVVNRRQALATANASQGEAAESLSESARNIIQTYEASVVKPLRDRIEELRGQLTIIEEDRHQERFRFEAQIKELQDKLSRLSGQVEFMKGELRRSDTALEMIVSITQGTYPKESEKALKIRRGQLE